MRLARTRGRVYQPTPATHRYTLPPPSLRRLPPTNPSYIQSPWRVAVERPLITRARAGRACVMGAPCGPSSRTHCPRVAARSVRDHTGPATVTPGHPRPQWQPHREEGARAGGTLGRGPGLAPPELPWFPGGQRRSPGGCGWPRHPVRSPSRSFRSWLGERVPRPDGSPAGGRLRVAGVSVGP